MLAVCNSGYEVWATKDNGRILKIGYVDKRGGTGIGFRWFNTSPEEQTCELLVIVHFALGDERM